jgi:hypothetical protein
MATKYFKHVPVFSELSVSRHRNFILVPVQLSIDQSQQIFTSYENNTLLWRNDTLHLRFTCMCSFGGCGVGNTNEGILKYVTLSNAKGRDPVTSNMTRKKNKSIFQNCLRNGVNESLMATSDTQNNSHKVKRNDHQIQNQV